ncbi:hypothetical protein C8F01DRAFT_1378153 [Mycena amicta]|nr:hypothetical protein C8F01DRAFT_1378153 [Mycena amicta]
MTSSTRKIGLGRVQDNSCAERQSLVILEPFQSVSAEWHSPMPRLERLHLPHNVRASSWTAVAALTPPRPFRNPEALLYRSDHKPLRQRHGFRELYESTGRRSVGLATDTHRRDSAPYSPLDSSISCRMDHFPLAASDLNSVPNRPPCDATSAELATKPARPSSDLRLEPPLDLGEVLFGLVLPSVIMGSCVGIPLRPSASSAASTRLQTVSVTPVERQTILVDTVICVLFAMTYIRATIRRVGSSR